MDRRQLLAQRLMGQPVAAAPVGMRAYDVAPEPMVPAGVPTMQAQSRIFGLDPIDDVTPRLRGQAPQTVSQTARDWATATDIAGASGGITRGVRAFHGSPHDFDRFDMRRIGTGEGAQAYGHGLYFAGNEDVARGYRNTLSAETYRAPNGAVWSPDSLQHLNVRNAARRSPNDLGAAIAKAESLLESAPAATRPLLEADLATLRTLQQGGGVAPNPGRMYEVNLRVDPNRLLDWDAPLHRQSPEVREGVSNVLPPASWGIPKNMTGAEVWRRASEQDAPGWNNRQQMAAEMLRDLGGIPGIRYLDGGSRAAGDGTRNYVMFDDSLIEILRKYGLAGIGVGLGATAATQAEAGQ